MHRNYLAIGLCSACTKVWSLCICSEMLPLPRTNTLCYVWIRQYRSHNGHSDDMEMDSLLNERRAVDSSRSMTGSIIEQAMATRNALANQRRQFTSSHGKVATLGSSFAGINTLVEQIRRKKMRNNTILALVIAGCICFTLWWVVLSKV